MKKKDNNKFDVVVTDKSDLSDLVEFAKGSGAFEISPTEQGYVKSKAMAALQGQTQMQLDSIYEQMKELAKQVSEIKTRVNISAILYDLHLNFSPVVGKSYYLYKKDHDSFSLSMISPLEWGESLPFESCLAHVQYMRDKTWKVLEDFTGQTLD